MFAGLALPISKNRTNADFLIAFLAQALWVCIIVGYIRFLTKIPSEVFLLGLILIVCAHVFYKPQQHIILASSSWSWPILSGLGYLILLAVLSPIAAHKGIFTEFVPRVTFMGWDGLISYNRWALEFVRFEYLPYQSYYPTGFPAAWSVIYDLQDSIDIWVFPTMMMFSLILFPVLAFGCFVADRYWVTASFFFLAITVLGLMEANSVTNGYMDTPVSLLLFLGLFWSLLAFTKEGSFDIRRLTTGFFLFSVAAVTKQPGLVGLGFGSVLLISLIMKKTIDYRVAAYLFVILFTPSLFSGSIFYATGSDPLGVLQVTRTLADENNNTIAGSLSYLISFGGITLLCVLFVCSAWSIMRGGHAAIFSLICIIISVIGFISFHDCCSYSNRNTIWIYSFLFAAAAPITIFWQNTKKTTVVLMQEAICWGLGTMLSISILIVIIDVFVPIRQIETYFRDRIGGFYLHQMFKRNIEGIKENGLLSFDNSLAFSTLVGPHHIVLEKSRAQKREIVVEMELAKSLGLCKKYNFLVECSISAVLEEKPCVRILLQTNQFKKNTHKDYGIYLKEKYTLFPLDIVQENKGVVKELLIFSQTCPQPNN